MIDFSKEKLTAQDAFWVMFYFLKEQYDLTQEDFPVSDILSPCEPIEYNENGIFDGEYKGNRRMAPADQGMITLWNEAIEKYKNSGMPTHKVFIK